MTGSSGEPSKVDGKAKELAGNVRENTTGLFSDKEKAKGKGDAAKGQAEHDTAQAKGWVEGATDSVIGNVKNVYGKVVGDKETEASGYAQATGGDAKKAANS